MEKVCNQEDCPYYGYFLNAGSYPPVQEYLKTAEKAAKSKDRRESYIGIEIIQAVHIIDSLKSTCLACKYFEKQDMKAYLISEQVLNFLIKG